MSNTAVRTINNTAITVGTNIAIKVFSFFATIFIARQVAVTDFGSFSFVIAVMTFLNLLVDMGVSNVVIKYGASDHAKLEEFFPAALISRLLIGVFLALITIVIMRDFSSIPKHLTVMYVFYILTIIPMGVITLVTGIFTAKEKIYIASLVNFFISITISIVAVVIILLKGDLNGLAVSSYVFLTLQVIILFVLQKKHIFNAHYDFDFQMAKFLVIKGFPFAVIALQTVLYYRLDVLMLKAMKGDEAVAYYNIANRYTDFLILIPGIIGSVTFPVLSRFAQISIEKMSDTAQKIIKYSFLISGGFTLFLIIFAPQLIILPFGIKFAPSVPVLMVLALTLLFVFINSPLTMLFYASGLTKQLIVVPALLVVANVVLNFYFIPHYSALGAAISTVLTEIVGFGIIAFLLKKNKIHFKIKQFFSNILRIFLAGCISFTVAAPFLRDEFSFFTFLLFFGVFILYFLCLFIFRIFDSYDYDLFKIFWHKYRGKLHPILSIFS